MVKKKEVIMFVKRVLLPVVLILVTVYIGMGQFLKKPEGSFVTNQQPSMNFPNMEAVERKESPNRKSFKWCCYHIYHTGS